MSAEDQDKAGKNVDADPSGATATGALIDNGAAAPVPT